MAQFTVELWSVVWIHGKTGWCQCWQHSSAIFCQVCYVEQSAKEVMEMVHRIMLIHT
jgi:hypothetical protein